MSNLDNLKDRLPLSFPKIRTHPHKGKGIGKRRMWAARLEVYRQGLTLLVFKREIAAKIAEEWTRKMQEEDARAQLESMGGIERSPEVSK